MPNFPLCFLAEVPGDTRSGTDVKHPLPYWLQALAHLLFKSLPLALQQCAQCARAWSSTLDRATISGTGKNTLAEQGVYFELNYPGTLVYQDVLYQAVEFIFGLSW